MDNANSGTLAAARAKMARLDERLAGLDGLVVAFSGGVDSSFLLARAVRALGDKALAVTVASPFSPSGEVEHARQLARSLGVRHMVLQADPLADENVAANRPDRCYYCKLGILGSIRALAEAEGIQDIAHGEHAGDAGDHRPGSRAAHELGALAPLAEVALDKSEIRALSKEIGLDGWDRPSMACLASRVPYGHSLTLTNLDQVRAAEDALGELQSGDLRVRHHGPVARIELPPDQLHLAADPRWREQVIRRVKQAGYTYISLDLEGFRSGSANEVL